MNNTFMPPKAPLPGATDETEQKFNDEIKKIDDEFKREERNPPEDPKLEEQKHYYIAIIVALIILFLIILKSMNSKPPCSEDDYECWEAYEESQMFSQTGGH